MRVTSEHPEQSIAESIYIQISSKLHSEFEIEIYLLNRYG